MRARWSTASPGETRALGCQLAARLGGRGVFLLEGELGSGKTVFAQGVAAGLGLVDRPIQSPTFTLVNEYEGPIRFWHVDLYRVDPDDVADLGLEEILDQDGVVVIEWADRLPWPVPGALRVTLRRGRGSLRGVEIEEVVA